MNKSARLAPLAVAALLVAVSATAAFAQESPTGPPSCAPDVVAVWVMDLFPPAPPDRRAEAAHRLSDCRQLGVAGALASVLQTDDDQQVRIEAARALGATGSRVGLPALRDAAKGDTPGVQMAALPALGRLGDVETVFAVLLERARDDQVRAVALRTLVAAGRIPDARALAFVAAAAGPQLNEALALVPSFRSPVPPAPAPRAPVPAPAFRVVAATPARVSPPPVAAPVEPRQPVDGVPLALTASIAAGGLWGGLSLLAQQDSAGVLMLLGSAGAVIGGGTAWGLTRFGVRPTVEQSVWFANATAWGSLAGLMVHAGSGSQSAKLKYGLLVGGETLGVAGGIWSARRFGWTTGQTMLADGLVLGSTLGFMGIERARHGEIGVSAVAGYGVIPVMLAAAAATRHLHPTPADARFIALASAAWAWSSGLVLAGATRGPVFTGNAGQGGLMAGLGFGFVTATAASAFTEVSNTRLVGGAGGLVAGNLFGLGIHMVADPDGSSRWALGAGVGGLALGAAGFALAPQLNPGPKVVPMTMAGVAYGAGTWALALKAASTGQPADARVPGGMLAGGVGAGLAGLVASRWFAPDAEAQFTAAGGTVVGMMGGLGVARLVSPHQGLADFSGVMTGAALGFAAGATTAHSTRLRGPDVLAAGTGAGYGALVGALIPTLGERAFAGDRKSDGGARLGLAVGTLGATAVAHATQATGKQVSVPLVGVALGLGMGVGAGSLVDNPGTQAARIGAVSGAGAALAGSLLLDRRLHLSDGLGPSWGPLALWGGGIGAFYGALLADTTQRPTPQGIDPAADDLHARQTRGGVLLGASAGLASGLVLSKLIEPRMVDYMTAVGVSALGQSLGLGIAQLSFADPGRADPALRLGGGMAGLLAGAATAHWVRLRPVDLAAGTLGAGFGAVGGSLTPSLDEDAWTADRSAAGGTNVGLALTGAAATTVAHLTDASAGQVTVAAFGTTFGLGIGTGIGMALPTETSRSARWGALAGMAGGLGTSLVLDRRLLLSQGLGPSAFGMATTGGLVGYFQGLLLAGVMQPSGLVSDTSSRQASGGELFGASLGIASGLALSKLYRPRSGDDMLALAGTGFGALAGLGGSMLVTDRTGRHDTLAALVGSGVGLGVVAAAQHVSPVEQIDGAAALVGGGLGGVYGFLAPSLGDKTFADGRHEAGGLLLGLAGGSFAGAALRHATDAKPRTVGLAALGSVDGLLTGLGVGRLIDASDSSQASRVGVVAGGIAGLGVGTWLWPRFEYGPTDTSLVLSASAIAGWTGYWLPALGHADSQDVNGARTIGGAMAGAGLASFGASIAAAKLDVDTDLLRNALLLDALLSGAGAGAGALVSVRDDAPVWGMLGAGTTGLLLGGAWHEAIDIDDEDVPLLTLAGVQGLWLGSWAPRLLYRWDAVTERQQWGGTAAGILGGTAVGALLTPVVTVSPRRAGLSFLGSGIGASIAGGSALLANDLNGRAGVGVMLGGTALGLGSGLVAADRVDFNGRGTQYGVLGAAVGASEGLVFAWAGRSTTNIDYAGAGLVGAGVGATLGLAGAAATRPDGSSSGGLASAGYAAWGAWIGSFSGALVNRDAHEVTAGGLIGANIGFAAGLGLLQTQIVEPRDIGWLSLFGAAGTVLGGGTGAVFSTRTNARPAFAGLAIGPAVGLLTGGIILPRLRTIMTGNPTAWAPPAANGASVASERRGADASAAEKDPRDSTEILAAQHEGVVGRSVRVAKRLAGVRQWMPMIGSLPTTPDNPGPAPMLFGVTGTMD